MADLRRLRDDLGAFSEEIGWPLTDWQIAGVTGSKRTTVIVAPRQSGKSRTLAVLALWWAFRKRGQRVLIVSASEDAARRLLTEVRRMAAGSSLLSESVTLEQAAVVQLSNGSEIRSTPASERQIRGWTAELLLVDEAALVPDDLLLGAALPTTAARPEAKIVLASSATTAAGAFYDFAVRGEAGSDHIATVRWALGDAIWLTPSVIEALRQSMSEVRFNAEMMGIFASGQDALFTREAIERCVYDDFKTWKLRELRGPAQVLGGCDWGATQDRSAITVLGRVPGEARLRVITAHRWPAGEPLHNVVEAIAASPARWAILTSERNGLGEPLTQELARQLSKRRRKESGPAPAVVIGPHPTSANTAPGYHRGQRKRDEHGERWRPRLHGIHTSAPMKSATYSSLRLLIDREQIELPASATDLIRELLLLRVDLSASGDEKIAATGVAVDDLADSLMLALGPHKSRHSGRWLTMADRVVRQEIAPAVHVADDPHAFQSVFGSEVTSRSPFTKPEPSRLGEFVISPPSIWR